MEAIKLEKLLIWEVSGVDDPANMTPGWLVLKRAISGEAPMRRSGIQVAWGDPDSDVLFAVTHADAPTIRVLKRDGSDVSVSKSALAPERTDPAGGSADPPPSAPSAVKSYETQLRDPETGRWRASMFRRAEPARLEGARFFK